MKQQDPLFDRILSRIKNNRVVAILIVVGTIVIALSTFSDAAKNLFDLVLGQGRTSAKRELSELPLPYTGDAFLESIDQGDIRAVKLFLRAGIDPNASDEDGNTALMHAVRGDHAEIIQLLLKARANVNPSSRAGGTSLTWAVGQGDVELLRLLLDHGATPQTIKKAFVAAAQYGGAKMLPILADRGVPLGEVGPEALLAASRYPTSATDQDRNDAVSFLLSRGVDVNTKDENGWTPLMLAARAENSKALVVRTLLDRGADVNAKCDCSGWSSGGWTALLLAAYKGHNDIVGMLVSKASDLNLKNNDGRTAMALAASQGHADVVRTLLDGGADFNVRDKAGMTPLMIASWEGAKPVVQELLDHGADPRDKDPQGRTAAQLARSAHYPEIIPLLEQAALRESAPK